MNDKAEIIEVVQNWALWRDAGTAERLAELDALLRARTRTGA